MSVGKLIDDYTLKLANLKENKSLTVDTNTDAENEQYDRLIQQCAEFVRSLKRVQANQANPENANCAIFDVSQQRELLIGFKTWEVDNDIKNLLPDQLVDWYLEDKKPINCG